MPIHKLAGVLPCIVIVDFSFCFTGDHLVQVLSLLCTLSLAKIGSNVNSQRFLQTNSWTRLLIQLKQLSNTSGSQNEYDPTLLKVLVKSVNRNLTVWGQL